MQGRQAGRQVEGIVPWGEVMKQGCEQKMRGKKGVVRWRETGKEGHGEENEGKVPANGRGG